MSRAFKYFSLAPVVESLLFEEFLAGNDNWVADYRLKELAFGKGVVAKEDDFRRVAADLVKEGRIRKFRHRSMYKWGSVELVDAGNGSARFLSIDKQPSSPCRELG